MSRVAAAVLAWAGAVMAQGEDNAAKVRALVAAGREAMSSATGLAAARVHFEAALALAYDWSTPFAQIGLATLARVEGDLATALERLAEVRQVTAEWPLAEELPRLVRFDLHLEACRCYLALGLSDRAGAELAAAAAFVAGEGRSRGVALGLARLDLHLAEGELRAARRGLAELQRLLVADGWLADELPRRPTLTRELRLRELLLQRRQAVSPAELDAVAKELAEAFAAESPGTALRTRLGGDAVAAFRAAGDLDRALAISERLCEPPFESLQRETEVKAQHLRLLLQMGIAGERRLRAHAELGQLAQRLFAQWRAQPLRPGGVGNLHYHSRRAVLGALLSAERAIAPDQPHRALAQLETVLALGTLSRRMRAEPVALPTMVWPEGVGALAYAVVPGAAHWFACDRDGVTHCEVGLDPAAVVQLDALLRRIARPPLGDVQAERLAAERLANELATQLLPPELVVRVSRWRSVVLVGDERQAAAWQALPMAGVPLGVGKAVVHVPSFTLLAALQERAGKTPVRGAPAASLLLFADPALSRAASEAWNLEDLRLRDDQLEILVGGSPGPQVRRLVREAATAEGLRVALEAGAAQLTIVSHGVDDSQAERAAGVAVAGPEALPMLGGAEVESLRAPPLVALGVCGAAAGPNRVGDDGVHHLGGAFLMAGAERVVLAGGQLAVGATIELLGEFTRGVRADIGPAEALRQARAAVRATAGREHPYYWAGLRLLGLPDEPSRPERR